MLRVFESFAGIGAVSSSLKKISIPFELVGISEIDKDAIRSFCKIHNVKEKLNYGDVTKINEYELPEFDLFSFGSPCQDFSISGKRKGAVWKCNRCEHTYNPLLIHYKNRECCPNCGHTTIQKTRSSLLVESLRIIRHKKPSYVIMENVKGITFKQFAKSLELLKKELEEYGYNTYTSILNARDFNIPQNRERLFLVGIRKEIDDGTFQFPEPIKQQYCLKDFLEEFVDKRYYIENEYTKKIIKEYENVKFDKTNQLIYVGALTNKDLAKDNKSYSRNCPQRYRVYHENGIASCRTLTANSYYLVKEPIYEDYNVPKIIQIDNNIINLETFFSILREQKKITSLTTEKISYFLKKSNRYVKTLFGEEEYLIPDKDTWNKLKELLNITDDTYDCLIDFPIDKSTKMQKTDDTILVLKRTLNESYKIRKLSPLESIKVMGFSDEDYLNMDKTETKIFTQSGNSIVINVLAEIFKNLLIKNN